MLFSWFNINHPNTSSSSYDTTAQDELQPQYYTITRLPLSTRPKLTARPPGRARCCRRPRSHWAPPEGDMTTFWRAATRSWRARAGRGRGSGERAPGETAAHQTGTRRRKGRHLGTCNQPIRHGYDSEWNHESTQSQTFSTWVKSWFEYRISAFLATFSPVVRPSVLALGGVQLPLLVLKWSERTERT